MKKIVILTGAGISAESGLDTFRDAGGVWAQVRPEDVATPEAFARNPGIVHDFYNARRIQAARAAPNPAHRALAQLQAVWPYPVVIVTQNVDGLHEAGGARDVLHMHGILAGALCATCNHRWPAPSTMAVTDACPNCGGQTCRPDIVWFGEIPYDMGLIFGHLATADLFVSIGTSGQVYPAAAFVQEASAAGANTLELNLEESAVSHEFDETRSGKASDLVPLWVAEVLDTLVAAGSVQPA
ncbi:MAG: NAD-dependent deacylase [Rhodobacteraceae bacterium]|nr:NAD-dependent deacylase [Paracoccaceae bacterium]